MSVSEWPDVLLAAGIRLDLVHGYRLRGEFPFAPSCVMGHHTAGGTDWRANLALILSGRDGVPGPLANSFISRDGVWHFVACGKSNNAGVGHKDVVDNAVAGIPPSGDAQTSGSDYVNSYYFGIEVDNLGTGEIYPPVQIDTLVDGVAAIFTHEGWPTSRFVHHRESTSRKIDMSYRGDLRSMIASAMTPAPHPEPPEEEDYMGTFITISDQPNDDRTWFTTGTHKKLLLSQAHKAEYVTAGLVKDAKVYAWPRSHVDSLPSV